MNKNLLIILLAVIGLSACVRNNMVSDLEFNQLLDKVGQGSVVEYSYLGSKNGHHIIRKWEMNLIFPGSSERYYTIDDSSLTQITKQKIIKIKTLPNKNDASEPASPAR